MIGWPQGWARAGLPVPMIFVLGTWVPKLRIPGLFGRFLSQSQESQRFVSHGTTFGQLEFLGLLETNNFEKLTSRAFWHISCIFLIKIGIWPFSVFFFISDLRWPSNWHVSIAVVKSFFLMYYLSIFDKVKSLTFFDLFSRLLTFGDLDWPRNWLSFNKLLKSFTLRYNLSTIEKGWNLTYIRDLWPHLTSGDLATTFLGRLLQERHFDIQM